MGSNKASIAIIGAGPRGISIIERIAALAPRTGLDLHLVEDSQLGAGRIWDTAQTQTLCMNTLAGAVTLFTEPGSSVGAPVRIGPTMFEWIRLLRGETLEDQGRYRGKSIAALKTELVDEFPPALDPSFDEEIASTRTESNPSRALYGEYLNWCYRIAAISLPKKVRLQQHHSRAVRIEEKENYDIVHLADGTRLEAGSTIMATGWQTPALTPAEEQIAAGGGTWIRPDNPLEQPVEKIPAGKPVLVRGLGMGFFDLMALTTINRGGVFEEDPSSRSGLRYIPSGQEPHYILTSGRGYPFLPKSDYKSLPPKAALPRLRAVLKDLEDVEAGSASIDFELQVWPAIVRDAFEAYYRVLAEQKPEALSASLEEILSTIDAAPPETIEADLVELVPAEADRFSLSYWVNPLGSFTGGIEELTEHIGNQMAQDISEAVSAHSSALKAGLWSISASRKPASILGAQGRYTWESRRDRFNSFMALGQMVGSGPPLFRTRQLLALVDAGLVSFLGARPHLEVTEEEFILTSPTTNTPASSKVLVDAWMHSPDIRRPADPLLLSIAERVRPFAERDADGNPVPTGSPEIDPATGCVVRPDGSVDERLHLVGIPTYAQMPDTTISPMPGTDPLMLQETDRVARHALTVVGVA